MLIRQHITPCNNTSYSPYHLIYPYLFLFLSFFLSFRSVTCGASPHPSIQVEGWVFGTSNEELVGRIKKPFMLLPAGSDG